MRTTLVGTALCALLLASVAPIAERTSFAQASSSDSAREELKKGYELKKAGHCDEAIPHLQESVRLDPELKALANLAECEAVVGKLVLASKHWRSVQQLAAVGGNGPIESDAQKRIAELASRVATVVVHLGDGPSGDTQVTLDDAPLASADLAAPVAVDPGKHTFVGRASGRDPITVSVELSEGQQKEILLQPRSPATGPSAPLPAVDHGERTEPPPPTASASSPWKTIGIVTAAAGVVGLGVGSVFGIVASSDKSSAGCSGTSCPNAHAASELSSAQSAGSTSTILFVVGGVLAAAGVTTWLLAPSASPVQVSPTVGMNGAGLSLRTSW